MMFLGFKSSLLLKIQMQYTE